MNKKVTDRYAPYNEEHKRILRREPGKKAKEMCKSRSLIFAEGLYLYVDGKWTQGNLNVMVYGASGAGKTRGIILPNILQLLGGYIVVDSSGEIEQKTRYGLSKGKMSSTSTNLLSRFDLILLKRESKGGRYGQR